MSYSTAADATASDGSGRNSPYTAALKNVIVQPELDYLGAFRQVQNQVYQTTAEEQQPWVNFFAPNVSGGFVEQTDEVVAVVQTKTSQVQVNSVPSGATVYLGLSKK